jgi:hypothetical protein
MPQQAMSPVAHHLVVAFARCSGEGWLEAMAALAPGHLDKLSRLLRGMREVAFDAADESSLSPPHERVLARATGLAPEPLADGLLPWAAREAAQAGMDGAGLAWGFVTPCHWAMGRDHATLGDPAALRLTEAQAAELRAAMQPYFATEGITLHAHQPDRWLAEGEAFRTLATASLDRVLGRNVDLWLPGSPAAASLRRLQNEMQMLLYTHPLNDERAARRALPVNSFWISGTGALAAATAPEGTAGVAAPRALADAAFTGDWAAYALAWQGIDRQQVEPLLAQQRAGRRVRISLCGEANAVTFESTTVGVFARLAGALRGASAIDTLRRL